MATVDRSGDVLQVRLSAPEKVAGLLRDVEVPVASVRRATVEADALGAVRGVRAPGLALPGRVKIGTWRGHGRTLVAVRRGVPALRLELTRGPYDAVLVSTPDAAALAAQLP